MLCQFALQQAALGRSTWTEDKIGEVALKADQAATRKKWPRAIKYGEQMLEGSIIVYGQDAPETFSRLKTLNRYYDKAGRLTEIGERVKRTYLFTKDFFQPKQNMSVVSRLLYYKLLIAQKDYKSAIPVVLENIAILTSSRDDQFKHLHYLWQLHGLYGLTAQLLEREKVLLHLLKLNKELVGENPQDNMKIILNLAKTYCLQKNLGKFKKLSQTYGLKLTC